MKNASSLICVCLLFQLCPNCTKGQKDSVLRATSYLVKVREIKGIFSVRENQHFLNIDDLCCDDENYLYVADSGFCRIFIFGPQGEYTGSFGRDGQGPGEFLAQPRSRPIRISFGNDHKIYITDLGNRRISIFSTKGKYLNSFHIRPFLYDSATVTAKGDIFLISNDKFNAIDWYDQNFQLKGNFFDRKLHFHYLFFEEPNKGLNFIDDRALIKMVTKNNDIIIFSNIALMCFHFDEDLNLVNKFSIDNKLFVNGFIKKLKEAVAKGSFIVPFSVRLDNDNNLCLLYGKSIYRYALNGTFIDTVEIPKEERVGKAFYIDNNGNYYFVMQDRIRVGIYKTNFYGGEK